MTDHMRFNLYIHVSKYMIQLPTKPFTPMHLTLSYTGGGGGRIPPLLTLVLNSVSSIQAIVLMFADFSLNLSHITFLSKFEGYGVFRFHGNGLLKGYFYEILSKIMLFSFTVNFSSDLNRK